MWYVIIGVLGGTIAGMGMGGGTLTIPLLTIFMSVGQKMAQGVNLIGFIPVAIIALIIHTKNGLVEYKKTLWVALTGLITAVGSAFLVGHISNAWLGRLFGLFLLGIALWQLIDYIKKTNPS